MTAGAVKTRATAMSADTSIDRSMGRSLGRKLEEPKFSSAVGE